MTESENKYRILVIDDEVLIAKALKRILKKSGFDTVELAHNSEQALVKAKAFLPHLVLSDINLEESEKDGIILTKEIVNAVNCEVIFVSAHTTNDIVSRAKNINPKNYIVKPFDDVQVKIAVEMALVGADLLTLGLKKVNILAKLTKTERTIIALIADNNTSKDIATKLFISAKTVENHRANIMRKLDLKPQNNSLLAWSILHKNELA